MNAPPVQYVKASDGYDIAFTMQGSGETLVVLPFALSHSQDVWTSSSATPLLEALSERFRVLYYDGRGQGLSQRGLRPDDSIESLLRDLRAVLDVAGSGPLVLLADNPMAHVAARLAAASPKRIKALVLMHCPVSLAAQVNWVGTLARQNWEYFLGFQSGMAVPLHEADISRQSARLERLRARTTQEDFLRFCDIFAGSDLSETLGRVEAPTLVLHIPGQGFVSQEESSQTAALLRNGRLVVVPGAAFFGEPNAVVSAVEGLLAETASKSQATAVLATHALSPREIEVLRLLATGKSNQQIADALFISLNTVNRHVSNVYAKTGAANRAEAVTFAHHHGLAD